MVGTRPAPRRAAAVVRILLVSAAILPGYVLGIEQSEANRECAMCHIMWLAEFKQQQVETLIPYDPNPIEPSGRQDITSTEDMCFSCHDGFVLDSRSLWESPAHDHPVGVVPSANVRIPTAKGKTIFPLNDDGRLYCGSCHSAHGVSWEEQSASVFLRFPNENSSICIACHLERSTGPAEGNHNIEAAVSTPPADLLSAGAKFGRGNQVVCQSCHRIHGAADDDMLLVANDDAALCANCHGDRFPSAAATTNHPVEAVPQRATVSVTLQREGARLGTRGAIVCSTCHEAHGAANATLLRVPNRRSDLCVECHEAKSESATAHNHPVNQRPASARIPRAFRRQGAKVGPRGELVCESCHGVHDTSAGGSLLNADNRGSALCLQCHVRQSGIVGSRHDAASGPQATTDGGVCDNCHVTHGGFGPLMWARPLTGDHNPVSGTCLGCHDDPTGQNGHPIDAPVARDVGLPTHAAGVGQRVVTCASCHDPHDSSAAAFVRKVRGPTPGGRTPGGRTPGGRTPGGRTPGGRTPGDVCLACHDDKGIVAFTDHEMGEKSCGACHGVHESLWGEGVAGGPEDGEQPCLRCHSATGSASSKVPTDLSHPKRAITAAYAPQRGADVHLVNDPATAAGTIGCRTCHEPHTWSSDPSISAAAQSHEGDVTSSFLRGGDIATRLCSACHGLDSLLYYKYFHDRARLKR